MPRKDYGHPVSRNRLYIVLVKCDLMVSGAKSDFVGFCAEICNGLKHSSDVDWFLCLISISTDGLWKIRIMTWNLGFIIILELEERSPAGKGSSVGPRGHGKAVPQEEKNVLCQAPWLLNGVLLNPLQLNWQQVDFDLIKARSRLWQQMEICPQGLGEAKQSQGHTQITSSN